MKQSERDIYLETVAEDYGVAIDVVIVISDMLGEHEDYDGLLIAVQDYIYLNGE